LPATGKVVGLDLGIKDVAVESDGWKSGNPRNRQRIKIARIHARIAASRADFLHKTTAAIIQSADVIAIEDLHVKGMIKNHHLAGAIADVGMGEWTCPECGARHDRDVNAAKNILMFSAAGEAGINARGVGKELVGLRTRHLR